MTPYDKELQQLQARITHLRSAAAQLTGLYEQRDDLNRQKQTLTQALAEEQADVDKLEGISLSALLYSILGKKEEKLDQEKAEVCAVAARLSSVTYQLTTVEEDISRLEGQQGELLRHQARYDQLIQEKTDYLKRQDPARGVEISRLEARIDQIDSQITETMEAVSAGNDALDQAEVVQRELSSADSWGTFDLLGGGMLTTMVKHSHLDQAQRNIQYLQNKLIRFRSELSDVTIYADIQAQTGEFLRFADYFFDGLFADWMVLDHIHNAQAQISDVQHKLSELLDRLEDMRCELTEQSARLRQQLNELVGRT